MKWLIVLLCLISIGCTDDKYNREWRVYSCNKFQCDVIMTFKYRENCQDFINMMTETIKEQVFLCRSAK